MKRQMNCVAIATAALLMVAAMPAEAGLFNSRFDDFKELVDAGQVEDAAALYAREGAYFSGINETKRKFVAAVLTQRDNRFRAELTAARVRLILADREDGQMLRWQKLKENLSKTDELLAVGERLPAPGPLTTEGMTKLRAESGGIKARLAAEAPQALIDYGLFTEPSFAKQYPVTVRWTDHPDLAGHVNAQIDKASALQLAVFKMAYGNTLMPAMGVGSKVDTLYVAARMREARANSYLARRLVRERLGKEGWSLAGTGDNVLIAAWPAPESEVSSLMAEAPSSVDFKVLDAAQTPEKFIAAGGAEGRDLVVFIRPARVNVQKNESSSRQVSSQYQSGTRRVRNPAYEQAVRALSKAQEDLANIKRAAANASSDTSSTLGILSAVIGGVSEAAAESAVREARETLASTPQMIDEVVLAPYSYPAKVVSVKQSVTFHYAVYDPGTGKVSTGSTDRIWKQTFEVVDQVRADDPNRAGIMKTAKTSQYVDGWIKAPLNDKYEQIWQAIFSEYKKATWGI